MTTQKLLRTCTVEEMLNHVVELARAFDVVLLEAPGMKTEHGASLTVEYKDHSVARSIIAKPVHDETSYAVALHEVGHCLHPTGALLREDNDKFSIKLLQEESAWEWAEYYALCWTLAMEAVKQQGLESYHRTERARRADALREEQATKRVQQDLKRFLGRIRL